MPNLPKVEVRVGGQLGAACPSIGNQFILRSSSGLSQPPHCELYNELHNNCTVQYYTHHTLCSTSTRAPPLFCTCHYNTLHHWTPLLLEQYSGDKPEETGPPRPMPTVDPPISRCVFSSLPVFSAVFTPHFPLLVTKKSSGLNSLQLSPFHHLLPQD